MKVKKIKSSAIYYALYLSLIFALVLGGLILMSGLNQQFATQMDVEEILIDNASSGIAYGQINFKELEANRPTKIRLFNEGVDSVEITKKPWGAFMVLTSKSMHKNRFHIKNALLGAGNSNTTANLYLVDNGKPISIGGDARIEGNCFLPAVGLKRAYIEGKNYTGAQLLFGVSQPSSKQLPPIRTDFLEELKASMGEFHPWAAEQDSINASFSESALVVVSDGFVDLTDKVITGQVKLIVQDSIFVGRNTVIENAILKSKIIYVEAGFNGTVQLIASEKITLEEDVFLKYPSVVGVIEGQDATAAAHIEIGAKSQVLGTVFLVSETMDFRNPPSLTVETEAEVDGFVYCAGKTQLKGKIRGHLFTEKLFLVTASSSYENMLLDGQILDNLPENFTMANLLAETIFLKQIAWLD